MRMPFVSRRRFERIDRERADWKRWCQDAEARRVLDGFPPEAYEAVAVAIYESDDPLTNWLDLHFERRERVRTAAAAGLDAAWRVLTGDEE